MLEEKQQQHGRRDGDGGGGGGEGEAAPSLPQPLQVLLEDIPCVCSAEGGDASLKAALARLESLVLREPPLLPCVGQLLPRSWQAAMAMLRALRDGRDVTAAVQRALRAVATGAEGADAAEQQPAPEPEPTADAEKRSRTSP